MKLLYLKLKNRYRSLEPFEYSFLKHPLLEGKIDPMCLVGLNGSGKSNFLELISDIFYEVETFFLYTEKLYTKATPKYFPYANNRTKDIILFEIVYKIIVSGKEEEIKIMRSSLTDNKIKFYIKKSESSLFADNDFVPLENQRKYMPLVVAYTSGLNDLLTLPFIDLQDYYAQQVAQEALSTKDSKKTIPSPNLLLLNYDSNASIVVTNFLLANDSKLEVFKKTLRIDRMNSFRIVIRLNKLYGNKKVEVTDELLGYINNLRDCASLTDIVENSDRGNEYIFDFIINRPTKELFEEKFGSSQKLFVALTKLNLLNTLCIKNANRNLLRKKREKGQLLKFPQISTLDKIFSIERIELVLTKPTVRTEYEKISDGEHQFIHIIGGILLFDDENPDRDLLYLLDEPDTHFNPLWRSDFFFQLENILSNKKIEFLITTHSPFILSDCHGYNVFKFTRIDDRVTFDRVDQETYGSTFENISENIFETTDDRYKNFNNRMAKTAFNDIEKLHKEILSVNNKAQWDKKSDNLLRRIRMLGESIDRLDVLKEYTDKSERFKA